MRTRSHRTRRHLGPVHRPTAKSRAYPVFAQWPHGTPTEAKDATLCAAPITVQRANIGMRYWQFRTHQSRSYLRTRLAWCPRHQWSMSSNTGSA